MTISVVVTFLTRPQAVERLRGVDAVLSDSEFDLVIYNVETVEKRDQYLRSLPRRTAHRRLLVISLPPRPEDDGASLRRPRSRSSSSTSMRPGSGAASSRRGRRRRRRRARLPATSSIWATAHRIRRRRVRESVRLHVRPRPVRRIRAGPRSGRRCRSRPISWRSAPTAATRRASSRCRVLSGPHGPHRHLRGQRHAGPRGHGGRPRDRARRPGRPLGRRLRRHRSRGLRRADDGSPAALRVRPPGRPVAAQGDRATLRTFPSPRICRPTSWSELRRRH